jgi:hypothetical protein
MKRPKVFLVLCGLVLNLQGQETTGSNDAAPAAAQTGIIGRIPDGTPSPPAPKPELPVFQVKNTVIRRFDVVEAPEMPELPPIRGTVTATVNLVENPHLPELVVPEAREPDPAALARFRELAVKYVFPQFASLSATVYDRKRTLLKWSFYGNAQTGESGRRQYSAWSNVDFSHFTCFSSYQVAQSDGTVRKYELMMFVMGYDTNRERLRSEHFGVPYQAPDIPELPELATAGPAFVVMDGDDSDAKAVEFIMGLHELYQIEGGRMELAYQARIKAHDERKAYLLAHPPKPKNLTLNYWRGRRPENNSQEEKP